ncbi:phytanoyl-CoA dioxygenase family protein [Dyella terrae]|uniref:phytanoyl-CoA dioxygenase family protein n=1 Tax=Dyella terrae TaxID=522259 RepID=UPI001EFE44D9|nr:phytanoyl-CoA dioxygenase family protein [Dyella terrae]ULU25205.1 Phytanoyl-CoA dioxygenase [Dyella terrae]
MQIPNSVANQTGPWFMDEVQIPGRLAALDSEIRKHAENLINNGFTIIKQSMPRERCKALIEHFKAFASANADKFQQFLDADGHYPRIVNLHAAMPELFELFAKNTVAYKVQEAMFGAKPSLYTSLFYERGSAQPTHRDTPLFSTKPEYFYFGVWVALEDANEVNGALQVYPGGHKMPELDRESIAIKRLGSLDDLPAMSNDLWLDYQGEVVRQCKDAGLNLELLCVEAGDTVIWHPQLPHGGGSIQDMSKSRFSFVMHTTPIGVPVYHQDKFFNPQAPAPIDAHWQYEEVDGAYRVVQGEVDFAHKQAYPANAFAPVAAPKPVEQISTPPAVPKGIFGSLRKALGMA